MNVDVKIKKLDNFYALPEYKTIGAAGMDLYAAEDVIVKSKIIHKVRTGIAIQLPEEYEAQVRSRSGLASKGVIVVNSPGTIDFGFSGEICVLLSYIGNFDNQESYLKPNEYDDDGCHWEKGIYIKRGDRIAQLVIAPVYKANLIVVDELDQTERGSGGFGSTGI